MLGIDVLSATEKDMIEKLDELKVKYEGVGGLIDFTSGDQIRTNKAVAKLYTLINGSFTEVK
jgi:hypothetical protein